MDLGTATLLVGGVIGLFLALFGVKMLVTGRAPASTLRNFLRVRDAALYHLLFGAALLLMVVGQRIPNGPAGAAVSGFAIVLVGVALVKYRPRRGRPTEDS
ncbi:hypothetical protein [Couchioplanes caeruleus]|uniref:Uncharacterized protein n=2 Tax=Couchioplanes caeruleus TaxID=56438 RepID=A0A1K0FRZ3_9ACTN|nr:hypothetical protein [Couchioplanes caeruleus]OJF15561.1 hypothetical protein BG844_03530 [Couchioplanes caeruleus subsp. caeruleus]ROP30298.1 hypothetical protein EDD30_3138 [Couchioplanes caeruleus]